MSHSNSLSLKLNNSKDESDICFVLRTGNGVKDMIVEGTYNDTNETCRTSTMNKGAMQDFMEYFVRIQFLIYHNRTVELPVSWLIQ